MASVFLHAASNSGIWYARSLDPVSWMSATAFQFTAIIASMLSLFCFACLSEKIMFADTLQAQHELLSKNSFRAKIAGKDSVSELLEATRSLLECEPPPQVFGVCQTCLGCGVHTAEHVVILTKNSLDSHLKRSTFSGARVCSFSAHGRSLIINRRK